VFSAKFALLIELSPEGFTIFTRALAALSVSLISSLNGLILSQFITFASKAMRSSLILFFVLVQNLMFLHPSLSSISSLGYLFATPVVTLLLLNYFQIFQSGAETERMKKEEKYFDLTGVTYLLLFVALLSKTNLIFLAISIYIIWRKNRKIGILAVVIQFVQMSQITSYGYPKFWSFDFVERVFGNCVKIVHFGLETLFNSKLFSFIFIFVLVCGIILFLFQKRVVSFVVPLLLSLILGALPWMVDGNSLNNSSLSRLKMQHFILPIFVALCYFVTLVAWQAKRLPNKLLNILISSSLVFMILLSGFSSYSVNNDVEATGMSTSRRCKLYPPFVGWSSLATLEAKSSVWSNCVTVLKFNRFSINNNQILGFEDNNNSLNDLSEKNIKTEMFYLIFSDSKGNLDKCNKLSLSIPNSDTDIDFSPSDYRKSLTSGLYYLPVEEEKLSSVDLTQLKLRVCDSYDLLDNQVQVVALY
jgi:hypothetical protein